MTSLALLALYWRHWRHWRYTDVNALQALYWHHWRYWRYSNVTGAILTSLALLTLYWRRWRYGGYTDVIGATGAILTSLALLAQYWRLSLIYSNPSTLYLNIPTLFASAFISWYTHNSHIMIFFFRRLSLHCNGLYLLRAWGVHSFCYYPISSVLKTNLWAYNFVEVSGIILRVLRLEVSVWISYTLGRGYGFR